MRTLWKRKERKPGSGDPDGEQLLFLTRQLREEVVSALVAEGEKVWQSLSERLTEHALKIQQDARSDEAELESRIRNELTYALAEVLLTVEKRVDRLEAETPSHSEILIENAVRTEFEAVTERVARMLVLQRRQIDEHLAAELERTRDELEPKVVVRRMERANTSGDDLGRIEEEPRRLSG